MLLASGTSYNDVMKASLRAMTPRQALFREMVFGTLVYAVVLGFFNDYTNILTTRSYSTTFLVALVMQVLTYLTLRFTKSFASWVQQLTKAPKNAGFWFGSWLVLFGSKFVFLWVIELVFGGAVEVSGFVGLLVIIITMTVVKESLDYVFVQLAE